MGVMTAPDPTYETTFDKMFEKFSPLKRNGDQQRPVGNSTHCFWVLGGGKNPELRSTIVYGSSVVSTLFKKIGSWKLLF